MPLTRQEQRDSPLLYEEIALLLSGTRHARAPLICMARDPLVVCSSRSESRSEREQLGSSSRGAVSALYGGKAKVTHWSVVCYRSGPRNLVNLAAVRGVGVEDEARRDGGGGGGGMGCVVERAFVHSIPVSSSISPRPPPPVPSFLHSRHSVLPGVSLPVV